VKTIIDTLAIIPTLNPKDLSTAFQAIFSRIDRMESSEIIATKQALDVMVKLSDKLDNNQEIIITHIIKAMQVRAAGHTLYNSRSQESRRKLVEKIFYLRNETSQSFHYDQNRKEFIAD